MAGQSASTETPDRVEQAALWGQRAIESCLPGSEWVLGLAVLPMLAGVVGIRLVTGATADLGELAEEIFRGDRLPILKLSQPGAEPVVTTDD
ncbi:MAG TPA: hypothetical protein V6D46_09055 [Coleofasciculaceae cyanobacterium]